PRPSPPEEEREKAVCARCPLSSFGGEGRGEEAFVNPRLLQYTTVAPAIPDSASRLLRAEPPTRVVHQACRAGPRLSNWRWFHRFGRACRRLRRGFRSSRLARSCPC